MWFCLADVSDEAVSSIIKADNILSQFFSQYKVLLERSLSKRLYQQNLDIRYSLNVACRNSAGDNLNKHVRGVDFSLFL